jgi:serine/threonine protein kinase
MGYMDPEYMSNAKLTCASDIYSFGIVALQLLSGQKVIELDLDARDQLIRKVYSCVPESQYYARVL